MRNLLVPAVLVASLSLSSMAMATTNNTTDGTIKTIDSKACTVTLTNKAVYHFAKKCNFADFKVGEKVAITWHVYKKIDVATKMVAWTAPAATTMKPAPAKKN